MNDGFGFMLAVLVLLGIAWGIIKNQNKKPIVSSNSKPIKDDFEEFDPTDIDREVDEMPDDSLIYDIFN
jgi:hypothetical protein